LAGLCGVALLVVLAGCGGGADRGDIASAEHMCQEFVADRLKSPSTAEYETVRSTEEPGRDAYAVSGTVDSQNSFGGMVRSQYTCSLEYNGNDRWSATSVSVR
jgi:hypothetical protein